MPRDAFVLRVQRELCHTKCARKVSGLSRNGPHVLRTHFTSIITLDNWQMSAETRSYIFRWRSRCRRRRLCLSSLINPQLLHKMNGWFLSSFRDACFILVLVICCLRACCCFTSLSDLATADDVPSPPIQETRQGIFTFLNIIMRLLVV